MKKMTVEPGPAVRNITAMTDYELVALAEAAYDDPTVKPSYPGFTRWIGRNEHIGCDERVRWNPMMDDGDAMRLAVKRNICISFGENLDGSKYVCAVWVEDNQLEIEIYESYVCDEANDDGKRIATRRAIVLVAAELGRRRQKAGCTTICTVADDTARAAANEIADLFLPGFCDDRMVTDFAEIIKRNVSATPFSSPERRRGETPS